jgi:2-methylcitrate dehydratase PrpD
MHTTQSLAEYIVSSRFEDIPENVVHEARRALVNIIGCAVGGANEEAVEIATRTFTPFFGPTTARVVGRAEKADPLHAALLNGISSHVHDYDDTLPKNYIHASSPVASALLSYATANQVSGRDFVHAFILGFETVSRVGNATYPAHYDVGWHSTGSCGVFGAAVAIGKLIGLDVQQMVWAIGLAATQAAGIREMFGSMGKAFHPGRAAQNGYGAALLAKNGFTSGRFGLEGPRGFASVLAAKSDVSKVTEGLGSDFDLMVNTYKPFPCGIVNHPSIDACIQIATKHELKADDIESVELTVAPLVMDLCGKRDITMGLEGKFSVVHGAAVGLVRRKAGLEDYTDAAVMDPDVKRVREATVARPDNEVTEDGVRVKVHLRDGTTLAMTLEHSLGNLERPMTDQQLSEKFLDQAKPVLPEAQVRALIDRCWRIDKESSIGDLVNLSLPQS